MTSKNWSTFLILTILIGFVAQVHQNSRCHDIDLEFLETDQDTKDLDDRDEDKNEFQFTLEMQVPSELPSSLSFHLGQKDSLLISRSISGPTPPPPENRVV